jgi:hypothetical protein
MFSASISFTHEESSWGSVQRKQPYIGISGATPSSGDDPHALAAWVKKM